MPAVDLIVVTADADAKQSLEKLLCRYQALRIRPITFKCVRHPGRDGGCRSRVHEFLRPFWREYAHALVVFDRHGCGDDRNREDIEAEVESRLLANGWVNGAAVVDIEPELEAWIWSPSPAVEQALGWKGQKLELRSWLQSCGLLPADQPKPVDPKEAMRAALFEVRRPVSASIFADVADKVSFTSCADPSFNKLVATLRKWFPESQSA